MRDPFDQSDYLPGARASGGCRDPLSNDRLPSIGRWDRRAVSPWRPFITCVALILLGNFLIHAYAQNWRVYDSARGHCAAPSVVLIAVLCTSMAIWADFRRRCIPPANVVLPSVLGGMMAVIAYMTDLPGLEQWMPGHNNQQILSDFELMAMPIATVWQVYLLGRWYRESVDLPF